MAVWRVLINAQRNAFLFHPSVMKPERNIFLKMITDGKTVKQATNKTLPKEVLKQKVKYILVRLGVVKSGETR